MRRRESYWWEKIIDCSLLVPVILAMGIMYYPVKIIVWLDRRRRS